MSNFDFLDFDLIWFFRLFFKLYSISLSNFIVLLAKLLEILGNMCITIACFPGCDIINFEMKFFFLIKLLFTWPKNQDKKLDILRTQRGSKAKSILKDPQFSKIVSDLRLRLYYQHHILLLDFCDNQML